MANAELSRIKGNIQKMIAQKAPEADIDSYLSGEGYSPEDVRDPIRFEVKAELNAQRKAGAVPGGDGLGRQFAQGRTFGLMDEGLALGLVPFEMVKRRTFNPVEAYNYTKARENILLDEARDKGGALGVGMEVAGGFATGGELAKAGATFMPANPATASVGQNIAGMVKDGIAYGAATGFGENEGTERLTGAAAGGAIGGFAGGVVGAAVPAAQAVGRNTLGWVGAVRDPQGYAERQVARALMESGKQADDVAAAVAAGRNAGQPFTVADALDNAGQRMLSTVARAPGEGRTATVNFLESRQAGQGRRVASALSEAFDAPASAMQARESLTAARRSAGNANYGQARDAAGTVDTSGAISKLEEIVRPGLTNMIGKGSSDNSVYGTLERVRRLLTNGKAQVRDFDRALLAKREMDAIIEKGGTPAALLRDARNALDDALAQSSAPYAAARDTYRQQSKVIDALDVGKQAATRGRTEDTTRSFAKLSAPEQQSFRTGYVDPLIEKAQGAAVGQNKAREFTSDALQAEIDAFAAPGKAQPLKDALGRENKMFETRVQALGGSRTADNLADADALGVNPEIISNLASGNYLTAAKNIVARSSGTLSGNTAEVRNRIAKILLDTGSPELKDILVRTYQTETNAQRAIANALRGALAGGAAGTGSASGQRTK